MTEKKVVKKQGKVTFPKDKLLLSMKYSNRKDLLNVLLKDDEEYSFEEVDKKIDEFMKGKVK